MEEIIPQVVEILQQYGYIIVFFGAVFAGEIVVLAAAFLASLGFFNIYLVILVVLAGTLLSDNVWYLVGWKLSKFITRHSERFIPNKHRDKIRSFTHSFNDHYKKLLVWGKFVYGIRIMTLVTCGHQKISYKKFFKYNLYGSLIWMIVAVSLGYFLGFSWERFSQYNEYVRYIIIGALVLYFILRFILKKFINLNGKKNEQRNR